MPRYYAKLSTTTYVSMIIYADNEEKAHEIAHGVDLDDTFQETEPFDLHELIEISEDESFDLPLLRQTPEGYEVV